MATREAPTVFPDTSKLTPAQMLELAERLTEQAAAGSQKEFEDAINYVVKVGKSLNRSHADVATAVVKLMSKSERDEFVESVGGIKGTRAANGSAVKSPKGPATHRDPSNPANVYRGKGPHPKWLVAALAADKRKTLADFAVK